MDGRPSPEVEVEEGVATPASQLAPPPPPSSEESGRMRQQQQQQQQQQQGGRSANRSAKRKHHDAAAPASADGLVSLDAVASVDVSGGDASTQADADVARWKRLYGGAGIDHESLQVRASGSGSGSGSGNGNILQIIIENHSNDILCPFKG